MSDHPALARAGAFCEALSFRVPILMAPMAGACPASLAVAVANAGGLGGCGALLMQPDAIRAWASDVRAGTNGGFQLNLWIPDPRPLPICLGCIHDPFPLLPIQTENATERAAEMSRDAESRPALAGTSGAC